MDQKKLMAFLAYWVANSIAIIIAAALFKGNVVLGNQDVKSSSAAVLTGLIITVASYFVKPIIAKSKIRDSFKSLKIKGSNLDLFFNFLANVALVWVLKWLASVLGMGISGIVYAILAGALLSVGQWAVLKTFSSNNS